MATVIRNHVAEAKSAGKFVQPIAFNFEDMNDRASEYLESVRREAAKIVQQAHQQAEQIRQQSEKAGRAAAEQAAQKALDEKIGRQLESIFPALEQLVSQLTDAKAEWLRHWESAAVSVSAAIAERIIRRELSQRPEISLEWISEALRLAAGGSEITLRLNPRDFSNLGSQIKRIAQTARQISPAEIVSDPTVSAGGCVVDTRFGQIDQQIEAQLTRIQEELK